MKQASDQQRRAEIGRERRARTRGKIISAAFELFGDEDGLYARIEDIAARAGVTRATFYNHFSGMLDLREAVTDELIHDFFLAVKNTIDQLDDPRERLSVATRFYLKRAQKDERWAWSIVNLSANGVPFGAETYKQAEQTVREGMADGSMCTSHSRIGRDIVLGTSLAAISSMLRDNPGVDYPERIAEHILLSLGVSPKEARKIGACKMPPLPANIKVDKM